MVSQHNKRGGWMVFLPVDRLVIEFQGKTPNKTSIAFIGIIITESEKWSDSKTSNMKTRKEWRRLQRDLLSFKPIDKPLMGAVVG